MGGEVDGAELKLWQYPGQKILAVRIGEYVFVVPFVEPSRKATRDYLGEHHGQRQATQHVPDNPSVDVGASPDLARPDCVRTGAPARPLGSDPQIRKIYRTDPYHAA